MGQVLEAYSLVKTQIENNTALYDYVHENFGMALSFFDAGNRTHYPCVSLSHPNAKYYIGKSIGAEVIMNLTMELPDNGNFENVLEAFDLLANGILAKRAVTSMIKNVVLVNAQKTEVEKTNTAVWVVLAQVTINSM